MRALQPRTLQAGVCVLLSKPSRRENPGARKPRNGTCSSRDTTGSARARLPSSPSAPRRSAQQGTAAGPSPNKERGGSIWTRR